MPKVEKTEGLSQEKTEELSQNPQDPSNGIYTITAKSAKMKSAGIDEISVTMDLGTDVYDSIEKHGERIVNSYFKRQAHVRIQDIVRTHAVKEKKDAEGNVVKDDDGNPVMVPDKNPEEIQKIIDGYKFSEVSTRGKSKFEKASALVENVEDLADIERLEAIIAKRRESLAAEQG